MSSKEKLINFICQNFLVEEGEIIHDTSLVDQGIIDSFGLVEISAFLKEEFDFETSENEMNNENFGSIDKILLYIEKKTG